MLRRIKWWNALHINALPLLPRIPRSFIESDDWDEQLYTLHADRRRITGMDNIDSVRVMARFAAQLGGDGYTQGFLYLLRVLSWVFVNDDASLYWAFVSTVDIVRPYGPLGKTMGGVPQLRGVLPFADPDFQSDLLLDLVSVRWAFILFAQTFPHRRHLLAVWDVVLTSPEYIHKVIAAMLLMYRFPNVADPMERLMLTMDNIIDTDEDTAALIARARVIHVS